MIAALQLSITLGTAFFQFRWAVYLFVLFLSFSPRSLGLIIGGGGSSLTFMRLMFPILLLLFFLTLLMPQQSSTPSDKPALMNTAPFLMLLALSLTKIITTIMNGLVPAYAVEDMVFSTLVFAFFYRFSTDRSLHGVAIVLLVSVLVTAVIISAEMVVKRPLHYIFADGSLLAQDLLTVKDRGGIYRVQGVFDNPLSLSEFTVLALPAILYLTVVQRGIGRIMAMLGVLSCLWIILGTLSRSGLLVAAVSTIVFFATFKWPLLNKTSRLILILILFVVGTYVAVSVINLMLALILKARVVTLYTLDDSTISTYGRALQYYEVYEALSSRIMTGFGVLQNFGRELDEIQRIDNYYLRVGLEAGVPGMVLFILFQVSFFRHINSLASRAGRDRNSRAKYAMGMSLMTSFAIQKLFVSMPTNNIFYFILMGCLVATLSRKAYSERKRDAYSART